MVNQLSDRQQRVLSLRFDYDLSQEEVGQVLGIGREAVRGGESRALRLLRHPERRRKLGAYTKD